MPQLDQDYLLLPHRLIADLQMNPAAIGVYALITRLFLIYQEPIPLSAADLQRYDPKLSYGAARGALQRLVALHWLTEQSGHKNHYTPTWGPIKGVARPWRMDAPTLGRPAHVMTLRLDRRLLDVGLGKLVPHPTYPAQTSDRYLQQPIFSLRDVGAYAQALTGRGIAATPALLRYGLIRNGQAQPLPSTAALIALASQRTLSGDGAPPTVHGLRKLGIEPSSAPLETTPGQPLFFVAHDLIPDSIICSIPELIPLDAETDCPLNAAERAETEGNIHLPIMAGNPGILSETRDSPPNPPTRRFGGGSRDQRTSEKPNQRIARSETESARLLQLIHAFPSSTDELAAMPVELVRGAIAYAESEPGIESIPGWVVEALRRHRDEGWPIPQPRKRANPETPIDIERYIGGEYGDLFMRGSDLPGLDDSDRELVQTGDQACVQETEVDVVQPDAGIATQEDGHADESSLGDGQLEELAVGDADRTSLVRLWNHVLNTMQVQTSRHEFNTWVRRTSLLSIANGVATIGAPSAFFKEGFENRYIGAVRSLITDLYAPVSQVRVVITATGSQPANGLPSMMA
jgi:hypothetical protein